MVMLNSREARRSRVPYMKTKGWGNYLIQLSAATELVVAFHSKLFTRAARVVLTLVVRALIPSPNSHKVPIGSLVVADGDGEDSRSSNALRVQRRLFVAIRILLLVVVALCDIVSVGIAIQLVG